MHTFPAPLSAVRTSWSCPQAAAPLLLCPWNRVRPGYLMWAHNETTIGRLHGIFMPLARFSQRAGRHVSLCTALSAGPGNQDHLRLCTSQESTCVLHQNTLKVLSKSREIHWTIFMWYSKKNRPKEVWFYLCRSPAPSKQSLLHKANLSHTVLASPSFWKVHAQICTSQKTTGQTQNTQRTKLSKAISGHPHELPQEDKETLDCTTYYFKAKSSWKQILLKNYAFKYFPPPTSFSTPHSRWKAVIKEM